MLTVSSVLLCSVFRYLDGEVLTNMVLHCEWYSEVKQTLQLINQILLNECSSPNAEKTQIIINGHSHNAVHVVTRDTEIEFTLRCMISEQP